VAPFDQKTARPLAALCLLTTQLNAIAFVLDPPTIFFITRPSSSSSSSLLVVVRAY